MAVTGTSRLSLLFIAALAGSHHACAGADGELHFVRGVSPELLSRYQPNSDHTFQCLDGSKVIPYSRVNDDYCDCPDGSDEPGTPACNNGKFYCRNEGHLPAVIDSRRVNDGVCDDRCCDGSDEWNSGIFCPDRCAAFDEAYQKELAKKRRVELAGGKIRQEYIARARSLSQERSEEIAKVEAKLAEVSKEIGELEKRQAALEERERRQFEEMDSEKERQLKAVREGALPAMTKLRQHLFEVDTGLRDDVHLLVRLLNGVKTDHNPEYNDPAVAEAVEAYDAVVIKHSDLEAEALREWTNDELATQQREDSERHKLDVKDYNSCSKAISDLQANIDRSESDLSELERILGDLSANYNRNYHDSVVKGAAQEYAKYLQRKEVRNSAESWLAELESAEQWRREFEEAAEEIGRISAQFANAGSAGSDDAEDKGNWAGKVLRSVWKRVTHGEEDELKSVRDRLIKANRDKSETEAEVTRLKQDLEAVAGQDQMFLALKGECMSKDLGQYTYEICWLGQATQIENQGGNRHSLGTFVGFNEGGGEGPGYFTHLYKNGAYCWNGPSRSIMVTLECGEVNEIISVVEPSKCEYNARILSPAACPLPAERAKAGPVDGPGNSGETLPTSQSAMLTGEQLGDTNPHDEL
ncbi:hypothetical protein EV182_002625 [Spiromyces aspiralis]|uniref:Uncharacterized protein n=1 Tax=Spiromyces aspiralis TaxID=68401 RepID=A0ACC1HHF1_9FUNG|nr:hypothetical protein EV182_002625 [Spiromyces aspiralis]